MCGCVCDDLQLTVENQRVINVSPGCALAEPWLLKQDGAHVHSTLIEGKSCEFKAAITKSVELLSRANAPLIYGLSHSSTPGQQSAVKLADRIGAIIDTTASTCHAPSILALQTVGESTATLGEVRQRSDLVIYWGSNPVISHPRHMDRFVNAPGTYVPNGRKGRHVVVIDVEETETAQLADTFIKVDPGADFEVIWALRALLTGLPITHSHIGGVLLEELTTLALRMQTSTYGAVFFGLGLTRHGIPHLNVEALLKLVTDLHHHTRFIARRMRIPGDVAGADSVLCWQTGYPFSVSLSRAYPRYNPGEFTANDLLERQDVDVAVLVGTEGLSKLSQAAQQHLASIPTIILKSPNTKNTLTGTVTFRTATYGIHRPGTAYRMDEIPIPLKAILKSALPADHDVLDQIEIALR